MESSGRLRVSVQLLFRLRLMFGPGRAAAHLALGRQLERQRRYPAAFRHYVRAARAGDAEAARHVGCCYLKGLGVPSNLGCALRSLERAAEGDDAEALHLLASMAMHGITGGGENGLFERGRRPDAGLADHATALRHAARAAELGSVEAQVLAGQILTDGPAALRDHARGAALFRQAATSGSPLGKLGWALSLLRIGAEPDLVRRLLHEAADANVAGAHYQLGTMADSDGAAARHFRAAAERGHVQGQFRYGVALMNGRGVPRDAFAGETRLREAAKGGDAMAAAMLGDLHARPGVLPPNYCAAGMWYAQAAEAGHAGAARALGQLYLRGDGFGADPWLAVHWLGISAAAGDPDAATLLPEARYWHARTLAEADVPDLAKARVLFLQAAEAGHADAALVAGEMLINGRGGDTDRAAAIGLFTRAALAGHEGAKRALVLVGEEKLVGVCGGRPHPARDARRPLPRRGRGDGGVVALRR
jgi:TPR repeat protein